MVVHVMGAFLFGVFAGAFYKHTRNIAGLAFFHGLTNSVEVATQLDFTGVPLLTITMEGISAGLVLLSGVVLILFSRRLTGIFRTRYESTDDTTTS